MRCLYYCTTPLQVLNSMNLHYNRTVYEPHESATADIAVVNGFRDAKQICERLEREGLFNRVSLVDEEDRKGQRNGLLKGIGIAVDLVHPMRLLKQQYGKELAPRLRRRYNLVVSSLFSHSVAALLTVNPSAEYVMVDDGIATYFGNWTKRLRSNAYLTLLKLFNRGRDISIPKSLYVFRPEMCDTKMTDHVLPLPEIMTGFAELAKRVFGTHADGYAYSEPIVWLTHVSNNEEKFRGTRRIAEILKPYRKDVIVRLHPREEKLECYSDYKLDDSGNMWELQLDDMKSENKLLITLGSTGAFTPKLLYGQEPWLLFAYKLIPLPNGAQTNDYYRIVERLREVYTCPEHICEPDSWEAFESFLRRFLESTGASSSLGQKRG